MGRSRASNDPSVRIELTERQKEVLRLIARGHTNGQIAQDLGLSLDGVKWHVREILTRLAVDSREEAATWWKHHRGIRERMPGWLGWPLAAGFGGVTASVVAAAIAMGVMLTDSNAPGSGEPEFLEQPELTLAGEGDGWRVYVDEEGGVPHARDAVLGVEASSLDRNRVYVVDAASGRIGLMVETLAEPVALLRTSRNQLLVSDMIVPSEDWNIVESTHRLLVFDLTRLGELMAEGSLVRRFLQILPGGYQWMTLSNNQQFLYWGQYRAPDESGDGFARYRAFDLQLMADSGAVFSQSECSGGSPPRLPVRDTAIVVACDLGPHSLMVFDAADGRDAELQPIHVQGVTGPDFHELRLPPDSQYTIRWGYRNGGLLGGIEIRIEESGSRMQIASNAFEGEVYYSIAATARGQVVLLRADGVLATLDPLSGEHTLLPYTLALPPEPERLKLVR